MTIAKNLMDYCQRCGNCCRYPEAIYLNLDDVKRLAKFYGGHRKVRQFIIFKNGRWQLKKAQPCQYLINRNECMIYDIRPLACRNFPLIKENGEVEILDMPYCGIKRNLPHHGQYMVVES